MIIQPETIKRLSYLDLRQYSGDLRAIQGVDRQFHEELMRTPVNVLLNAQRVVCGEGIYSVVESVQGSHKEFQILRRKVASGLSEISPEMFNHLTVLFDGIYVGEAEDLVNRIEGSEEPILYPIRGFGTKIADVDFVPF